MSDKKIEDLSQQIEGLTLIEVSRLVKELEQRLGVSSAPQMAMAASASVAVSEEKEPEKTEFDVILVSAGSEKIKVIKEIRTITGLPLKEAKELTEKGDSIVKTGCNKEEAQKIKETLEAVGASVKLS